MASRYFPVKPPQKKHSLGTLIAGVIGNLMEWYDFALYGYFASVLSRLFFPGDDPVAATLATWAVFAAGFVMRPLGSAIFGYIGDRWGRRRALLISVIFMGVPTFSLGLLPTYQMVGLAAPVLLLVIRLLQGLSVGGEFSSSVTYVVETSPVNRRGLSGSWANVGSMSGMLLGSALATLVTNVFDASFVDSWGWRLPFLFGGVIAVCAVFLRRGLSPSQLFKEHEARHENRSPIKVVFRQNRAQLLQAFFFAAGYATLFYIPFVYLPDYLSQYANIPIAEGLRINTFNTAALLLLIPLAGYLSDRFIRRRKLLLMAFGLVAVLAYPLFLLFANASFTAVLLGQLVFTLLIAVPLGTVPAMMVELFPTRDRLSGYSISYNTAMAVIGGSTPIIATWLISQTGFILAPAIYLAALALVSVAALFFVRDRSREPLL
jgi:MHS family proline/betaine transporter-like MFS transporter